MAWDDIPDWAQSVAQALLRAVKEKDPYTYGHCRRVARNARLLAKAAGLSDYEQRVIEFASVFHDLGKMGIPDTVLLKPGKLTPEEIELVKAHPVKSAEIISPLTSLPFFRATLPGIRHHHERVDGRGYPYGIKQDQIPLAARIIVIADTFDAMTTTRPYRKGLPFEVAYKELMTFAGRQFDPQLVKIFMQAHPKWGEHEEEITEEFLFAQYRKAA
ncbi:MAG: HD-GYP domain-containing protein [Bacteriovoracia bacterium]